MLCLSSFIFYVILVSVNNLDYVYFDVLTKFTSETDKSFFIEIMYVNALWLCISFLLLL